MFKTKALITKSDFVRYLDCPQCHDIREYIEIDNLQAISGEESDPVATLPKAVTYLVSPNKALKDYYRCKSDKLLMCQACGRYFRYRTWAPGGSEDVMRTYIHESIEPLTNKNVEEILTYHLREAELFARLSPESGKKELATFKKGMKESLRCLFE